jgi:putative FmdB family regulatory protein
MPTYDYICTSCGNAWELEQRIVEDPAKDCPKCGQATAKRQISSGAGFILKGGGWYADLYGSKPPTAAAKDGDKGAKSDKSEKSDTKTESSNAKPEGGSKTDGGSGGSSSSGSGSKGTPGSGDTQAA